MTVDPVSLSLIAGGLSLAATAFSTMQAVNKASFDKKVAERNAEIERRNQELASEEAQVAQEDAGEAAASEIGAMLAQFGASGTDLGLGSAAINLVQTQALAQRDQQRIRRQGNLSVEEARNREADANVSAKMAGNNKSSALIGGVLQGGSSLVGSASSFNAAKIQQAKLRTIKAGNTG